MSRFAAVLMLLGPAAFLIPCRAIASETAIDLDRAVILAPADLSGPEKKAVAMLADEVEKRTQIRWRHVEAWPAGDIPVIAVGQDKALRRLFDGAGRKFTA